MIQLDSTCAEHVEFLPELALPFTGQVRQTEQTKYFTSAVGVLHRGPTSRFDDNFGGSLWTLVSGIPVEAIRFVRAIVHRSCADDHHYSAHQQFVLRSVSSSRIVVLFLRRVFTCVLLFMLVLTRCSRPTWFAKHKSFARGPETDPPGAEIDFGF